MTTINNGMREWTNVTADIFRDEILPQGRPAVFRGLVKDWPVVSAARASSRALFDYMLRFDRGRPLPAMIGPPGITGRLFYNADLSGFNFRQSAVPLRAAADLLLDGTGESGPPAVAIQSVPVHDNLPGFERENRMPLLDGSVEPRVWIGNAVTVAAHHDDSENIACVVAGGRRFTLFPPDQVANLYMGPFELTPAGMTISMVDFDRPDLQRFPRFADALAAAHVVDLEPGDAIHIPYLWWHHVRSTEPLNMLVNYWWSPATRERGQPRDAFLHALLAIKDLSPQQRAAWRAMFDHYVFQEDGPPAEHLPSERRGVLGPMDAKAAGAVRASVARSFARS